MLPLNRRCSRINVVQSVVLSKIYMPSNKCHSSNCCKSSTWTNHNLISKYSDIYFSNKSLNFFNHTHLYHWYTCSHWETHLTETSLSNRLPTESHGTAAQSSDGTQSTAHSPNISSSKYANYNWSYCILHGCIKGAAHTVFITQHSLSYRAMPCDCSVLPAHDRIKGDACSVLPARDHNTEWRV